MNAWILSFSITAPAQTEPTGAIAVAPAEDRMRMVAA